LPTSSNDLFGSAKLLAASLDSITYNEARTRHLESGKAVDGAEGRIAGEKSAQLLIAPCCESK
jgi:hypothetical protein